MVKIKKEKAVVFKSASGTNITLDILIKDENLKMTVLNSTDSATFKRGLALLVLTICNLLIFIFNILNAKCITAIFIIVLLDLGRLFTAIQEENLIVIKGLGTQITTKYMLGGKTIFIPQEQVQKVFINEVLYRSRVIYVLSLLAKDKHSQEKLLPLFFGTLPRLACLKVIYKHLKAVHM